MNQQKQQAQIAHLTHQLDRCKADTRNAYGLLEDERKKYYGVAPKLREKDETIESLNKVINAITANENRLINQMETMRVAGHNIKALHAAGLVLVGAVVGFSIGAWWSVLWTL